MNRCMGNPKDDCQCDKCARLPRNRNDEDEAEKWVDWKKMAVPCKEFIEVVK